MNESGIYGIYCPITGKCLYVGQTCNFKNRWNSHKKALSNKTHSRKDLIEWMEENNLFVEDLKFKIIEKTENIQKIKNEREFFWYHELKAKFGIRPSLNYIAPIKNNVKKPCEKICSFCYKKFFVTSRRAKVQYCSKNCQLKSYKFKSIIFYPRKETLEYYYTERKLTTTQIAQIYHCSQPTIVTIMNRYGIERRNTGKNKNAAKQFYGFICGHEVPNSKRKYCDSCSRKLKTKEGVIIDKSAKEILNLLNTQNYEELGRSLGVTGNAIRNFLIREGIIPPKKI